MSEDTTETMTTATPAYQERLERAALALSEAEEALERALTPDQQPLYEVLSAAWWEKSYARESWLVGELARHLPGVAPALRALVGHIRDDDARDGTCCRDMPAWP